MYILMISRGIPSKDNPQWGCFERDQAEALVKFGHKVVVLSIDARFKRKRGTLGLHISSYKGVDYYNYVTIPAALISTIVGYDLYMSKVRNYYLRKVYEAIESEFGKPDIIYSHFFWNTCLAVKIKEQTGIPVVAIEHLARFNESKLSKSDKKWSSFAFNHCDSLISVSDSLAISLKRHFGRTSRVIHNMYGSEFGFPVSSKIRETNSPIVFVSVASLVYRKGFDVLIKSFAKLNLPKEKWHHNIIGWGEEKDNLEQLIINNGLQRNITLLGKKNKLEIAEELRNSDVFVLPSRNENFSVSVLEGLSVGLPVLATDCGGIRECINDDNGVIVPVDDVDKMSDAIRYFILNIEKYNKYNIAKDCANKFSDMAIAKLLTDEFNRVLFKAK